MSQNIMSGVLLNVEGIESDEIAYNPAVIVQRNTDTVADGKNIIAARVENVKSNWLNPHLYDPRTIFFIQDNDTLHPLKDIPVFAKLEDPWATWIRDIDGTLQILFGGVKVDFSTAVPVITTMVYKEDSIQKLNPEHPFMQLRGMKDIRFAQLKDGRIAIFTRPTIGKAAPGRIGFLIIKDLQELTQELLDTAPLLHFGIDIYTKIGTNEAFAVEKIVDGESQEQIRVFCHLATVDPITVGRDRIYDFEKGVIHYSAYEFYVDPQDPFGAVLPLTKIADRKSFIENTGLSKGERFNDVIFPSGTGGSDQKILFAGVEDARIGIVELSD